MPQGGLWSKGANGDSEKTTILKELADDSSGKSSLKKESGDNSSGKSASKKDAGSASDDKKTDSEKEKTSTDKEHDAADKKSVPSRQDMIAEIEKMDDLDPTEKQKLIDDLKQTDAAIWPLFIQQVRATSAYRKKAAAKQSSSHVETVTGYEDDVASYAEKQKAYYEEPTATNEAAARLAASVASRTATLGSGSNSGASLPIPTLPPTERVPSFGQTGNAFDQVAAAQTASTNSGTFSSYSPNTRPKTLNAMQPRPIAGNRSSATAIAPPASAAALPSSAATNTSSAATTATNGRVAPASYEASSTAQSPEETFDDKSGRNCLEATIHKMEAELPSDPKTAEEVAMQAKLRMLYLLAGQREDAAKPIPSASPAVQDFWAKELYGLSVLLDSTNNPDPMLRSAEGKRQLEEALARLGESAPLIVRNASFCTAVASYGCATSFKKFEFTPDQEVLLYAEVENFKSESTPKGYYTSFRSSYQIIDSLGHRVADRTLPATEEFCQNPRRDFFIGYHLRMPERLNPGHYTFQLTLEDLKSQKVGQANLEFDVIESEKKAK